MVNLADIKEALRIDFPDHDTLLQRYLDGEKERAEQITGLDSAEFNSDIENGIIKAVESMYSNRTDIASADLATSTLIYRRYNKAPMI